MRRLILAIAVLALLAGVVWAFLPRPVEVEVADIAPRTLEVAVAEEGEARIREVFTISAAIGGKLRRIDLHAGDPVVAQETVVAVIGPAAPALLDARARSVAEATRSAAQSAVDLAVAQVTQAEAALEFRTADADRSRALFGRSAISQRVLDTAILEQRTARAALDSAKANLAVRGRELQSAEAVLGTGDPYGAEACCVDIIAPVSGRVLRVLTENEQVVQPGTPIMEIGNPGNLEIAVDLLSRDAVRVREGSEAQITGWGGAPIAARVERIEPSATTKVSALGIDEQRVMVILNLRGDPTDWQLLGHGFRVIAHITLWKGDAVLTIPVGALFRDGSDWATYVVQDGRARLRIITLGERNESFAQVHSGVAAGDQVILHPSDLVAEGTAVSHGSDQ
ncbi:HlyD family efflux transporter periplasmic adaptor subunit [Frigidibacter albus]|uniref:HlyD family efflux transporter periplasmic adaptor subunit n=1 Tax=Frigidibacter albus TaxID=1465486 RepID=A0A6L8VPX3_9RHOB|nr:HlyD family efflux transporter periplasmic adaptor subunit [Frigidibacter albus]MZQ91200.1 HlyD family efflux transporter periplasmic adaptor subunit [Frigidibacter albus]NBE33127.1 HlyD family efflux transporter periplasmic adaptor subunit [Frigidibacter albus]GGH63327.1 secretion protein HlyD [Frigidibacter albus]